MDRQSGSQLEHDYLMAQRNDLLSEIDVLKAENAHFENNIIKKGAQLKNSDNLICYEAVAGGLRRLGELLARRRDKKQAIKKFRKEKVLVKRGRLFLVISFLLSLVITYIWIESRLGLDTISDNMAVAIAILAGIAVVVDSVGILLFITCFLFLRIFFKERSEFIATINRIAFVGVTMGAIAFVVFLFIRLSGSGGIL